MNAQRPPFLWGEFFDKVQFYYFSMGPPHGPKYGVREEIFGIGRSNQKKAQKTKMVSGIFLL